MNKLSPSDYLKIVGFIVTMAVAWTTLNSRVEQNTRDIVSMLIDMKDNRKKVITLDRDMSVIKNELQHISRLQSEIKDLLTKE